MEQLRLGGNETSTFSKVSQNRNLAITDMTNSLLCLTSVSSDL